MSTEEYLKKVPTAWAQQIEEILYTPEEIQSVVTRLAQEISKDYGDEEVICVALLKGAFLFFSDLVRQLTCPTLIDFIVASSYEGTESTGTVTITKDLSFKNIEGKNILIIEDLIDTGKTLDYVLKTLNSRNPKSVRVCTFLNKEARRTHFDVKVDYNGIMIEDKFVVGYGMDYDETLRSLPFVGVLKPSIYKH